MPKSSPLCRFLSQSLPAFRSLALFLLAVLSAPKLAIAASEGMKGWVHEVGLEGRFAPDPATACKGYDGPYGRTLISMERHTSPSGQWDGTAYRCNLVHLDVHGQPSLFRVVDLMCESGYHKRWPGVCVKGPKLPDQPPSSCPYSPGAAKGNPADLTGTNNFMREQISKLCPKLLPQFDRWSIFPDPHIDNPFKRAGSYATTKYSTQSTQFNFPFFNREPGDPSHESIFAHEFRHTMKENDILYRPGDGLRKPSDTDVETDADNWSDNFLKGKCEC